MKPLSRRLHELVEPIHLVCYMQPEPNDTMAELGFTNYWDGYFAGRAAPLGLAPAEVVDAVFYNFAPGEVARHIPKVWSSTTPADAHAARQRGCVAALQRVLDGVVANKVIARSADTLTTAATSAPVHARPLYAGLKALPVPEEPFAKLWHAATLLREHRGDGHNAVLLTFGIAGTEAHVLAALNDGMPAREFGRIWHLPAAQLDAVIDGLRQRGLIGDDGWLSEAGSELKQRIEDHTDELAAAPYSALSEAEIAQLTEDLSPAAAALNAAASL